MKFTNDETSKILDKLLDLKNIFQFGEKIVPMIQSLTNFMKEIVPLLVNINFSISESNKKLPEASNKINSVTNATELATTEILDLIDNTSLYLEKITSKCNSIIRNYEEHENDVKNFRELISNNPTALAMFDKINFGNVADIKEISENVNFVNDHNFRITMSLQVQDITSQQLAAVNHLMNAVHNKLNDLINEIDNSEINNEFINIKAKMGIQSDDKVSKNAEFNPDASFARDDRQMRADDIISSHREQASQDEIDKLFLSNH